ALSTLEIAATDSTQRGEGIGLTVIEWSRAVLWNGLGEHDKALSAAQEAVDCPTNSAAAAWGMVELVEAAARLDQGEAAGEHAEQFAEIAHATGSEWAAGVRARMRPQRSCTARRSTTSHGVGCAWTWHARTFCTASGYAGGIAGPTLAPS